MWRAAPILDRGDQGGVDRQVRQGRARDRVERRGRGGAGAGGGRRGVVIGRGRGSRQLGGCLGRVVGRRCVRPGQGRHGRGRERRLRRRTGGVECGPAEREQGKGEADGRSCAQSHGTSSWCSRDNVWVAPNDPGARTPDSAGEAQASRTRLARRRRRFRPCQGSTREAELRAGVAPIASNAGVCRWHAACNAQPRTCEGAGHVDSIAQSSGAPARHRASAPAGARRPCPGGAGGVDGVSRGAVVPPGSAGHPGRGRRRAAPLDLGGGPAAAVPVATGWCGAVGHRRAGAPVPRPGPALRTGRARRAADAGGSPGPGRGRGPVRGRCCPGPRRPQRSPPRRRRPSASRRVRDIAHGECRGAPAPLTRVVSRRSVARPGGSAEPAVRTA